MIKVAICVCTRKRPDGIITLLKSFESLHIPQDIFIEIIVVENDKEAFTEKHIKDFSSNSNLSIAYFLETKQGISNARNRAVSESKGADYCCFVDDDQSVSPEWLFELFKCRDEFDSDGVWGPNPPIYESKVKTYIEQFHTPEVYEYGTRVTQAYTNCLLIKKSWLDKFDGPFDLRLNFTGGEDCFLTAQIIKNGGVIRYTPYAKAFEIVPASRTTIRYILKRTFRTANTKLLVQSILDSNFRKYSVLPRLIMRFGYGLIIAIPCFFSRKNKLSGLLKISDSSGGFMFVFGRKNKFYK